MKQRDASRLTWGLILVMAGLVLLTRQFDVGWTADIGRLWPLVFLAIAAGHLVATDGCLRLGRAAWFAFLGMIFLLHTFRIASLRDTWPLFIVVGGLSLLVEELAGRRGRRGPTTPEIGKELR
jgi:hypothetical protein